MPCHGTSTTMGDHAFIASRTDECKRHRLSHTHQSAHNFQKPGNAAKRRYCCHPPKWTNAIYQVANPKIMNVCDMMREILSEQFGECSKLMGGKNEINDIHEQQ